VDKCAEAETQAPEPAGTGQQKVSNPATDDVKAIKNALSQQGRTPSIGTARDGLKTA